LEASVPWKDFAKAFANFLEVPKPNDPELPNRLEWQCLHALLEVDSSNNVIQDNFSRFLNFFGPVRTGPKEGPAWLDEIRNLLSQKWFHGPIDVRMAQNRILAQVSTTPKKIPFPTSQSNGSGIILRFSNSDSTFTLTYRKPKESNFTNVRLTNSHFHDIPSLISYVETFSRKYRIEPTSYERKYQPIFDKYPPLTAVSAYSAVESPDEKRKK